MPNRHITISEEEESLQSLGLFPNATLVMIPVQIYTAAYDEGLGLVSRGLAFGHGMVSRGIGLVAGTFGTFIGISQAEDTGRAPAASHPMQASSIPLSKEAGKAITIRTLRERLQVQDDQTLYNGNQVRPRIFNLFHGGTKDL